jgi:cyanate permease
MRTFFTQLSLDLTGFWVSVICGLHCVAVPVLVSFAALNVTAGLHESIEYSVLGLSSLLGTASLLPSFFRHDRNIRPVVMLILGFICIGTAHLLMEDVWEPVLTGIGALLIAGAHILNFRLCKKHHQKS